MNERILHRGFIFRYTILLLMLSLPSITFAENLDDFKTAAGNKGIDLIPFGDLRRDANSIENDKKQRLEELKSLKIDGISLEKPDIMEKRQKKLFKNLKINQEAYDREKAFLDSYKTADEEFNAKLDTDGDLAKLKKMIDTINQNIKTNKSLCAKATDEYNRVNQLRGGLRDQFNTVLSKLSDAKSNPEKYLSSSTQEEKDKDKEKLIGYISTIDSNIKSEIDGHKTAENEAKSASSNYDAVSRLTE